MASEAPYGDLAQCVLDNEKGVFPKEKVGTGTFDVAAASKSVYGTGTNFIGELLKDDYLYSVTLHELSKIVSVQTDRYLTIETPFTAPVAGEALMWIKRGEYEQFSIANKGGADALVNGIALGAGCVDNLQAITPLVVDATGTIVRISTTTN
jgi:hypothetical protein